MNKRLTLVRKFNEHRCQNGQKSNPAGPIFGFLTVFGILGAPEGVPRAARGRLRCSLGGSWALFGAVLVPKMAPSWHFIRVEIPCLSDARNDSDLAASQL